MHSGTRRKVSNEQERHGLEHIYESPRRGGSVNVVDVNLMVYHILLLNSMDAALSRSIPCTYAVIFNLPFILKQSTN
ncbi:hypothetical protein DPMN_116830 [Dreissena polymorpha]|uniref:Uncharacterized protein n=1 Tax=Dreissena polymorpha TaxID=45954 RepID=A0A9D4QTR4_DREPO|nr:hypothetical protein DPMN_116830 [Dreissena polymorpha]